MTESYRLNSDTGFASILDGDWTPSSKEPFLVFSPIPNDETVLQGPSIPYAFRPQDQKLQWKGEPEAIITLECGHLTLLIERRFLHPTGSEDATSPSGTQFSGIFGPNPDGCWGKLKPKNSNNYTELQPIEGETVLLCGHLTGKNAEKHACQHFWKVDTEFTRPDGSRGRATWFALCEMCHKHLQAHPKWSPPISTDAVWKGNAPAIREPEA